MKQFKALFVAVLLLVLAAPALAALSKGSLSAKHSNQGYTTDYLFSFTTMYSYQWAKARIDFPIEYDLASFETTLDCWISNSGTPYDYRSVRCWIEPSTSLASYFIVGSVYVQLSGVVAASPLYILLRNVINPINRDMTSFFAVAIEVQDTEIQSDRSFARLLLNNPSPAMSISTASFSSSPTVSVVGQGSTYIFRLPLSPFGSWYSDSQLISVRALFPQKFQTYQPLCSIAYNISAYEMTYIPTETSSFQSRGSIVQCRKISSFQKYLSNGILTIKINTVVNPLSAQLWSGISFEIVRSVHNELVETISLGSPIDVVMESFIGSVKQTNNFRNATCFYFLYLNHDVILGSNSTIQITIGNGSSWNIHAIELLGGFTSPKTTLSNIRNGAMNSTVTLSNYGVASRETQQYIAINLTSPLTVGYHQISVKAQINSSDVGFWSGTLYINSTYGQFDLLSLSAVRKKVKLGVNATGSLELTFFLNYQLPPSQGLMNGTITLSIFPQLIAPNPDINGVLKCYFKGMYDASNCTLDNTDPIKSLVTIVSPPLEAFQYSEVPILLTTQGAVDQSYTGFPINPLVTRYRFETAFYLYNSSVIPSQVFYSEWIADAVQMSSATVASLTHECNEFTNIQVNLTMPDLSSISASQQLRILVQFMSHPITKVNAWDSALGYASNRIYKEYPCVITGLPGTRIRCDLYTYHSNSSGLPYNNLHINTDFTGPFFLVYGFPASGLTGLKAVLEFPKLKIGSLVNVPAMVKVSILEETPAMLQPYVQLYFQNITAFTTLPAISIFQTAVSSSQIQVLPVQTNEQYNISWSPTNPSLVSYIKYEILSSYFPSFPTASSVCTASNCFSCGLPANWIVEKPTLPVGATYSMQSLWAFISTIPFISTESQSFPIHITTYDGLGNTVNKVFMNYNYSPQQMIGYFDFEESVYFAGLDQWYSISFQNAPVSVSSYPFIRLTLDSTLIFSTPIQCNSSTILSFNSSGLLFTLQSSASLIVYNIMQILPSSTYQLNCRLRTAASHHNSSISPQVNIQLHHNYTLGDSFVAVANNVTLQQAPVFPNKGIPYKFQIDNPQIMNQQPQVNYVGPLFIDFTSQNNSLGSGSLQIVLSNHRYNKAGWTTPSGTNSDPPVCFINTVRYSCSWTNNPLTISITNPKFALGVNQIELTSEYVAPYNGVKFPGSAGEYAITLNLLDSNSTLLTTHSFFANILPPSLLHFQASSIVKDIGTQSVYIVNITIPTWGTLPNPYNHGTNYSRIFIEFPTTVNGNLLFSSNLGGYNGLLNERVGCSFVLGAPYLAPTAGNQLQCILIPPEFTGGRVKIEIINHNGFTLSLNSMAVYIFKVFNPAIAYDSFDLLVSINQYQVGSGFVYPIFASKYSIFLDPYANNSSPIETLSVDNQTLVNFFESALSVGNYGAISLTAQSLTGNYLPDPYYVIFKLPPYLPPENNQVSTAFKVCSTALFELCITSPEIQYVLVKARSSPSSFQVYIRNYPAYTSQVDSLFYASVIEQGRYVGKIIYNITGNYRWKQLQGVITFNSVTASGSALQLDLGRKYTEILVSFTTQSFIPATGTIEIVFSSNITKIYPNCRSATGVGSGLFAASGSGALGPSGEIGCSIQNTNHWVITSFLSVNNATTIIIKGYIDLPVIPGTIGVGEIITYADANENNIYSNGSRIDYVQTDFGLTVSATNAMNINKQVFMSQRTVLSQGYVGEFRFIFTLNNALTLLDYIELSLYKFDIKGNGGGFSLTTRPKVCEFIRIDTEENIGCFVDLEAETFIYQHQVVMFHLKSVESLLTSVTYELRLTSQDYNLPEGINYPTSPGTFKIDFLTNHTQAGVVQMQQRYIQVIGTSFSKVIITQFNFLAGYYSPFWVELSPTFTIAATHQIILQFPTRSNDGVTRLFLDDLGWTSIANGEGIPIDMFDCAYSNTFMNCRLFYGSYLYAQPAKIICGNLQSSISSGQTLKFAFSMTNPSPLTTSTLSQLTIPIFIYSYDPSLYQKINFNTVNTGAVINNGNNTAIPNGYFATNNNQLQTKNEYLYLSRYNSMALTTSDYYVVKFHFPLRVNIKTLLGCRDNANSILGTIYYHENLRTVICAFTVGLAINSLPTFANLALTGFYTPWYALTAPEAIVYAIASYQNSLQSEFIQYYDSFPLLAPRSLGFTTPVFQLAPILSHNIACQQNDYIFTMRLENNPSVNFDLQYTKMVMISMPSTALSDFQAVNTDCMEHSTSTIEIVSCQIDPPTRTIQIVIVPGYYQNGNTIAVVTRGLAIRNPCSTFSVSSWNAMYWTVYYLSFQNGTAITPSTAYAYMTISSANMQFTSLTINYQHTVSSFYTYSPFDWFEVPYERYYNEFLQYDVNQYSPFSFEFQVSTAIPAVSYNRLTVQLGSNYLPCGSQFYVDDLPVFTPICYLRNTRIQRCVVDMTTNTTYMEFNFSLPVNTNIHAYFSVVDPRNPQLNGYSYIGTEDVNQLFIKLTSLANTYLFQTPPFESFQTQFGAVGLLPVRGISFGTIDYANNVGGQLNVLDMVLTVSRTDITALKFQIPMVDEFNNQIFGASYKSSFFNLENGDEYPCGNNQLGITKTGSHKCYIFYGGYNIMGSPVQIIMTDFNQGATIKARLMITNPSIGGAWITVNVKAYTGTQDQISLYGGNFAGSWSFQNILQISNAGNYYTTSNGYVCCWGAYLTPSAYLWRDSTTWTIYNNYPVYPSYSNVGDYVIFELLLYQYNNGSPDDQICTVNFGYFSNTYTDDVIILKSKQGKYEKAYFIKKWTGANWSLQYFKCKHYNNYMRAWYNPWKTIVSIVDYNHNYFYDYYPAIGYPTSLASFYIFPLNLKTYVEIDLTNQISQIFSQGFIWDNNVKYILSISYSGFCPSVSKCAVVEGLVSSYMNMPISCVQSGCGVVISGFTQVLLNPRLGKYRVKVQLQHSAYSFQNGWPSYSPTVNMYAHSAAMNGGSYNDWYIFSGTTSFANLFSSYSNYLNQFNCQYCHNPLPPNQYYTHYQPYSTNTDFTTSLLNVGMNAAQTTLQLHLTLTPKHTISMNTGYSYSFPQFRFLVNNYPFFCSTITKYVITLHRFGNSYPLDFTLNPGGMITCSRMSEIEINFYYWKLAARWGLIWAGGVEGASWFVDTTLEFDIEMSVFSTVEPIYYRQWISVTSFVDLFQYSGPVSTWNYCYACVTCPYESYICAYQAFITNFVTAAYSEDLWQPLPSLFNSVTLQPLTNNINEPTEMSIIFSNTLFAFGPTSYGKLLLVQIDQNLNPFTYLNSSTLLNRIECKCITDNLPGQALDQICYFRDQNLNNQNTAITIDIQLTYWMSATCFFPEWKITAGSLSVTAKLTNDYGGFPSYYSTYTTYGSYYQTISFPPLNFANNIAIPSATLSETSTPLIYSPTSQVYTFQVDYALSIIVPQATTQAIIYLDFQKGGVIPSTNLCTNTYFLLCRVYTNFRYIMIAQFKSPTSAGGSLLFNSNFGFNTYLPAHWAYGLDADYAVIARVIQSSGDNFYSFKGTLPRTAANLIPTPINITVNPQRTTGTILSGFLTNIILSFTMGNVSLKSYYTNNNAHIDITCSNPAILLTSRGCTVVSVSNPLFQFYCLISGSTLTIQNRYYNTPFFSSGLVQVIIGITNPVSSITFTLKGYAYYISATNYGLSFTGSGIYTPTVLAGVTLMQPNQLKMYRFNTKINSNTAAPFRAGFKLSTAIGTMPYPSYYFVVNSLNVIGSYSNFECLFRQFSTEPSSNQQVIFPNSYRNYKQRTQHLDLYVNCYLIGAGLQIEVPHNPGLLSGVYYELVIMPAGTTQTGFANSADTLFKVIAHPLPSERIDQQYLYVPSSFTLDSIQIVTKRPLSPTALLIKFEINFNSPLTYPSHYFEIVFRDLDMTSIRSPYNTPGSTVPCTLSSLFVALARTQSPLCIIQKLDVILGTIIVRVTQIGKISMGTYQFTFDDFLLPDLISPPLQDSSPFTLCLRFHDISANNRYENCFDELFVMDYATNAASQLEGTKALAISNTTYGSLGVSGDIKFTTYPMTSTSLLNQKFMMRVTQGYAATSGFPLNLQGYTPIWSNPMVNLYIFQQKAIVAGSSITFTLDSLSNPEVYQMSVYSTGAPSIELTFYNAYQPIKHYAISQPTFSSFSLENSQIFATSVLYTDDVKLTIPFGTPFIYQMQLVILDSSADIIKKQIDNVAITFDSNVNRIEHCWIDTKQLGQAFQLDGECVVVSSNSILLQGFDGSFNSNNLTIYLQLKLSGSSSSYTTTVKCKNGQVQYLTNAVQFFVDVNASTVAYPLLDFTENLYTPYYYELVTPLVRTTQPKYLYFSLQIPADLTQSVTTFSIAMPLATTFVPNNASSDLRLICEWLTVDRYARRYVTGVRSVCTYTVASLTITIQAPFGGLPRLSVTNTPINYLLKIREFFVTSTLFKTPTTSKDVQIVLTHQNSLTALQDTLTVYPYVNFQSGKLSVKTYTLTAGELNTYDIAFTPQNTVSIGKEAVLQLSIDSRYMPSNLGLKSLYQQYGLDATNSSWINDLGYNIGYSLLPNNWINGMPYSGYTSTFANAEQTCVHQSSKTYKLALLLQSQYLAGTAYNWKIPLLLNPSSENITFRMNLTLYTYWAGTARHQKELFYEIINPFKTSANYSLPLNYTFSSNALANIIQSSTASINVDFGFPFVPDTSDVAELKISSRGVALIGLANFYNRVYSDSSYSFYFFKRINLVLALKTSNNSSPTINFGAIETTNKFVDYFGYDWVKIHSNTVQKTIYNAGSLFSPLLPCSVVTVTPVQLEGTSSQSGSEFLQQFSFTSACAISLNSTMVITYDGSLFYWNKEAPCYTSFRSTACTYNTNGSLSINFNENIVAGTTIAFSVYLRSLQNSTASEINVTGYIYALPDNSLTVIDTIPLLVSLPSISSSDVQNGGIENIIILPLYQNTYMPLLGRLVPHYLPLTYIEITHPFTWTPNSHHRLLYRLNGSSLLNYTESLSWVQTNQTQTAANFQHFVLQPNGLLDYSLTSKLQYTFLMSSTYDSGKLNNFSIGAVGSFYNFIYESDQEYEYEEVYPVPIADLLTLLVPIPQIDQTTALGLKFKMATHSLKVGDIIEIYLDSHNLHQSMYQFTTIPIECAEGIAGVLSPSAVLTCNVWQYPQNKQPMIIRVYPTKAVAINTQIQIWISPLINPAKVMVAGAIVKVTIDCLGEQRCEIYEARGYFSTKSSMTLTNYSSGATFTPSNLEVQKSGVAHTYTFNTQTVSAAFWDYPENYNNIMVQSCTNALGKCIVFPNQKRVLVIPTVATSLSTLQLLTMRNGMYEMPISTYINLTVASASTIDFYTVNHTQLTTIKTNYVKSVANSMTIIPTQSPNLFLRNYMNTATITLSGLYTDPYVNAFYLHAPSDIVTWDITYCNATLGASVNNPYPTRLNCGFINDITLSVLIPEGVSYVSGVTDGEFIIINCKFQIKDFSAGQSILYVSAPVTSGTFNAYGSYSQNIDDFHYYITEASQTIAISQYQIPPIGDIGFTTESYMQRFANINDTVSFDLLFDPATTDPITSIEIQLPKQFGYPPVGSHDNCKMIARTTVLLQNCQQVRRDDNTYIVVTPPANYNNGPVIITISNQNESNWFTAPSLSGGWYNYTVSAYGANGTLLQREYSQNCSTIGGLDFDLTKMSITHGVDALMEEIVDINFMVGREALRQGYSDGLQTGSYYTTIEITFENWGAFGNLLGSEYVSEQLIGCVTQGLVFTKEVQCLLVGGGDIEHQPTVIISGYERVPPFTNVSISLANILMLNSNTRNVLWVSVVLHKVGSWKQSYLYNPESLVFKRTSNLALLSLNSLDLGYVGSNKVGSPSTFYIVFNPSVDITTYFLVKFPMGFLNRNYTAFSYNCAQGYVQIFYRSDLIRIYPNNGIHQKGVTINYTISNFPSTDYVMDLQSYPIVFEGYNSYKQIHRQTVNLMFQSYACGVTFGLLSASSLYSYDTNVNYTFEVQMSSLTSLSDSSIFALLIPSSFPSLFSFGVSCHVAAPLQCSIMTGTMVVVRHIQLLNSSQILISLVGLTNPATTNHTFIVQTFKGDSLDQIMCQSSISVTTRKASPQKCQSSLSVSLTTINQEAKYHFSIICPQILRNNSAIKIQISNDYMYNNHIGPLACWSDKPLNLKANNCELIYSNATVFILFKAIVIQFNQASLGLNVILNNTIFAKNYQYQIYIDLYGGVYGTSDPTTMQFSTNLVNKISSISLYNVPAAGGSKAIYILKIHAKYIANTLQIDFPQYFDISPVVTASTYFSNSSNWSQTLSYFDLLQYTYQSQVISSVSSSSQGSFTISASNITISKNATWLYLLLKFITNPSYYDPTYSFAVRSINAYRQLLYVYQGPFSLEINVPSSSIHMIGLNTGDSDLLMLTVHNITYRVDEPIYTNFTSFVITPPQPAHLDALQTLQCCLILNYSQLIQCHACTIGKQQIEFQIATQGLLLLSDQVFTLQLTSLFTPDSSNQCQSLEDYLRSYYSLMVFRNRTTLTHESIAPSADLFTPCQNYVPLRGDVLFSPPTSLYAGLAYEVSLSITRPSKMLRVYLKCLDLDLIFTPNVAYFNSYDLINSPVYILVNPNSKAQAASIRLTHQESIIYNIFRDNLPITVQIRTDTQQYVIVQQSEYLSVGSFISIPVILTHIASYDLYLSFTLPDTASSLFEFQSSTILIPSLTQTAYFKFRYNGDKVPQTLNVSLLLQSPNQLKHTLKPAMIYFFFSITQEYQTLPPVMKLNVMHQYINNSHFTTKQIYNANTSKIYYDQLRPYIIKHDDVSIGSTKASIIVFTRHEAEVYYVLKERGNVFSNATPTAIRTNPQVKRALTSRNSSQYVNAYTIINFTRLSHQTMYSVYAMAHDSLGDSQSFIIHTFMTNPLPNAVELRIDTSSIITDSVYLVHAISQILNIDILRVKDVDSYVIQNNIWTKNTVNKNQLYYRNLIVVSPSLIEDTPIPLDLVKSMLINNAENRLKLKQILPEFIDNFNQRILTGISDEQPLIELIIHLPKIKSKPNVTSVSYYNLTFTYQLWSQGIIYTVATDKQHVQTISLINISRTTCIEGSTFSNLTDDIPYSKQIVEGKDSYNQKAAVQSVVKTDQQGKGVVQLTNLKPGTKYQIFITFTTIQPYQPIIYASTAQIMKIQLTTLENPNIKGNYDALVLKELKSLDPEMYEVIMTHKSKEQNRENLH